MRLSADAEGRLKRIPTPLHGISTMPANLD